MECNQYDVYMDGEVIAQRMTITTALLLIEAFYNRYWDDNNMEMSIKPCQKCECKGEENTEYV